MFPESAPSYETIVRFFHKHRFSRKVLERRHILRDVAEILEYREEIAAIEVLNLISIDETASSPDQFKEKYGWAVEGQKAMRTQFKIGSKHFSVMAAYSMRGFRHWKIVEGSINGETFQEFLREMRDDDLVENNECLILDNCKIHKTQESLLLIIEVFGQNYKFLPKYSPHWNPIELAFSQIKRYLRGREYIHQRHGVDLVEEINQAFLKYSEHGDMAHTAAGNWAKYFRNYAFYNN